MHSRNGSPAYENSRSGRSSSHATAHSGCEPNRCSQRASSPAGGCSWTGTGPSAAIARCALPSPSLTTTDAHARRSRFRSRPPATVANQNAPPRNVNPTGRACARPPGDAVASTQYTRSSRNAASWSPSIALVRGHEPPIAPSAPS